MRLGTTIGVLLLSAGCGGTITVGVPREAVADAPLDEVAQELREVEGLDLRWPAFHWSSDGGKKAWIYSESGEQVRLSLEARGSRTAISVVSNSGGELDRVRDALCRDLEEAGISTHVRGRTARDERRR